MRRWILVILRYEVEVASLGENLVIFFVFLKFVPLGREKTVTAFDFFEKLYDEAEAERKLKKRNQLSGLYKYVAVGV